MAASTPRTPHGAASGAEREFDARAAELIAAGQFIHARGWVPATSGNFSARLSDGSIAITVSGRHKGALVHPGDIMRVDAHGKSLDGQKPSAETLLHTALYRRYPEVGAVLHPHSLYSTLISRLISRSLRGDRVDELVLEGYELLKAVAGIHTHEARVVIPIFPNDQDIPRLSDRVNQYLDTHGDMTHGKIVGYLIAGHGFYTWGTSVADALRHVEALEYLFELETRLHGVQRP